jgi:methylase of polypeptide subunit release factors
MGCGGPNGTALIELFLDSLASHLLPNALAALEVGSGQTAALASRLDSLGFTSISAVHDLSRHDRFLFASAPPETP